MEELVGPTQKGSKQKTFSGFRYIKMVGILGGNNIIIMKDVKILETDALWMGTVSQYSSLTPLNLLERV